MTLEDLKIFVAVCDLGSLSAVARQVGCTQPAVSQHIARLERALAVPLLDRTPKGVSPTVAGQELRAAAAESLSALASGLGRIREISGESTQTLAVTTGGTSVRHFLKRTVVGFRASHPEVTLSFLPANSTTMCLDLVRDGKADLALVTIDQPERGIEHRIYARQDLRLLVPLDHKLSSRREVSLQALDNEVTITLSGRTASQGIIAQTLDRRGVHPSREMTVDDFDTAAVFVELGLGLAIIPAVQAYHFAETMSVAAIRLRGSQTLAIGLAARRWSALSKPAIDFIYGFHDELRRMRGIPGVDVYDEPES